MKKTIIIAILLFSDNFFASTRYQFIIRQYSQEPETSNTSLTGYICNEIKEIEKIFTQGCTTIFFSNMTKS